MKRFLTALAVALLTIFVFAGCNDYGNTFQANTGAVITTLSPSNITAGSPSFTLTINGSPFVAQTYVTWNNQKLVTTDIDDSAGDVVAVSAAVPASLVATAGNAVVQTHNPFSGAGNNGLSNPLTFLITPTTPPNPTPLLQSVTPNNAAMTSSAAGTFILTLAGSDFLIANGTTPGAMVCWQPPTPQTTPPTTTPPAQVLLTPVAPAASSTQITVTGSNSLLNTAGAALLIVLNPPFTGTPCTTNSGGISSASVAFTIFTPNPVPTLTSISPNSIAAGSQSSFTLAVAGTNFLTNIDPTQASTVFWNAGGATGTFTALATLSSPAPTSSAISVTVPASLVAAQGTASVLVQNPPSRSASTGGGGGKSNSLPFTIGPAAAVVKAQAAAEETPAVSADGRYVAYTALQGQYATVFFHDTCQSAASSCQPKTSVVSVGPEGAAADEDSHSPSMSADGRYVAFASAATNLLATNNSTASSAAPSAGRQIYLRDTCTGAPASCVPSTELVSTDPTGQLVGTEGILPSVSASGRFVAFVAVTLSKSPTASSAQNSSASNSGYRQVFVRDTCLGVSPCTPKTTRISLQPGDGTESAPATATPAGPALSGDAKKIALSGGGSAVLFTQSVAVDDRLFVAALGQSQ